MVAMVDILVEMMLCLCRHTAMQQELEKLRVKLRTADFVRTNSGSGLEQRCSSSALLCYSKQRHATIGCLCASSVQSAHSCASELRRCANLQLFDKMLTIRWTMKQAVLPLGGGGGVPHAP